MENNKRHCITGPNQLKRSGPSEPFGLVNQNRGSMPPFTGTVPLGDFGQPTVRWRNRSSWGGSLSHSESMGGGWENRGPPAWLVDGKAVGGEVVDDDGSDQWLPK
jgi:hypothetical protein